MARLNATPIPAECRNFGAPMQSRYTQLLHSQKDNTEKRCPAGGFWTLFLLFFLSPFLSAQSDTTLAIPPVTIREARFDQTGFAGWRADSLPLNGATNLSERLFWENPVALRTNAPGTLATVSARGAGPSRTPVFWNGLNLQSPQNGVADAALLPIWPGDRLEVRFGGQSAALSSGAMGGSVLVETPAPGQGGFSGSAGGALGSFGNSAAQAAVGYAQEKWASRLRANWQRAVNDFPYSNTTQPGNPATQQANNRLEKLDIQQFNRVVLNEKNTFRTAFWQQRAFREIPPAMTEAASETWQRDRSSRLVASWEHSPTLRALWQTRAAWVEEAVFFNLRGDVDSSRARTALLNSEYSATAGNRFYWKTGATAIHQWAQADGYADTARWYGQTRLAGYGMVEWRLPNGRLTVLLRQEWTRDEGKAAPFTWSLGGQTSLGKAGALRFQLSRNFNLPTFNDRFWLEYGRSDLKPEKGYSADLGWVYSTKPAPATQIFRQEFSAEAGVFQLLLDDWILWLPGPDGIFRPGNLRKVWSRGLETGLHWKLEFGNWKLGASGRYQYAVTTNVAVYGGSEGVLNKQLPYTPNHSAGAVLRIARGGFSGAYLQQWTGKRFTTSDNLDAVDGFTTGNLLLQWDFRLRSMRLPGTFSVHFRLENLWDSAYQVIEYRPMPGRAFRLGVTLSW